MKSLNSSVMVGALALAFSASGWAACYIGTETNAESVQADSGNGTYSCQVVSTSNGMLADVTGQITWSVGPTGRVTWSVPVNANGYPTVDVDLVSVSNNSGKRCNYSYPGQPNNGTGLSTSDLSTAKYVTVCADGVMDPEPPPPPPVPFSTAKDGCDATFNNAGTGNFDVAIGYTKQYEGGQYEGAAICAGPGQKQCINECVPREYDSSCQADVNGKYPLSCAQCEWDAPPAIDSLFGGEDMKYCWYYENRVNEVDQNFKPSPKKKSLSANIDVTTGSDCYTVTVGPMYGGRTYSYWYCPTN